jgi:hypothetical protein
MAFRCILDALDLCSTVTDRDYERAAIAERLSLIEPAGALLSRSPLCMHRTTRARNSVSLSPIRCLTSPPSAQPCGPSFERSATIS